MGKLFVVAVLVICFAAPARADQFANDPIEQFVVYAGDAQPCTP
jgi:hypothetical protein